MTLIAKRPAEVATRTVLGHWEGDLIKGACNASAVWTPSWNGPRASSSWRGYRGRMHEARVTALPRSSDTSRPCLRKTLTYDRGKEMAEHE
jgi:IS30 family transposase